MGSREGLTLREKALEALEKSTKMLQVALDLMMQGNQIEATRVRQEARKQRTISTFLMAEANSLDLALKTVRPQQNYNTTPHRAHSRAGH